MIAFGLPLVVAVAISATPGAEEHLLHGAAEFRERRFEGALVEFRVAGRLGAPAAEGYAAAALVMLGRPLEALEAFAASPPGADALLAWYHALALHQARLYTAASRALAAVDVGGPRVAAEVAKLRADTARVLAAEPPPSTVEWYLGRCDEFRVAGRGALAGAYCREAAELGARRADRHGVARAKAALARIVPPSAPEVRR